MFYLLGEVGGFMGLLLGASALSLCELLDLLLRVSILRWCQPVRLLAPMHANEGWIHHDYSDVNQAIGSHARIWRLNTPWLQWRQSGYWLPCTQMRVEYTMITVTSIRLLALMHAYEGWTHHDYNDVNQAIGSHARKWGLNTPWLQWRQSGYWLSCTHMKVEHTMITMTSIRLLAPMHANEGWTRHDYSDVTCTSWLLDASLTDWLPS